jgi:hypothetical protein
MTTTYGQDWADTARNAIVALLEHLRDDITDYSPTFSYVYERHHDVMRLPAASVDISKAAFGEYLARTTTSAVVNLTLPFSIRVHLDYAEGVQDGQAAMQLLNGIANKLEANRTLAAHCYIDTIEDIEAMASFTESDTVGGQLTVNVQIAINHSEE